MKENKTMDLHFLITASPYIGSIFSIIGAAVLGFYKMINKKIEAVNARIDKEVNVEIKLVNEEIDLLKDKLHQVREDLPKTYITKQEFDKFEDRLFKTLDTIQSKL